MGVQEETQIVDSETESSSKFSQGSVDTKTIDQRSGDRLKLDRRSRIETLFDVLCVIGGGVEKPTHIMYKANLSWSIMQVYIDALIRKTLITAEDVDGKKRYRVSQKGRQVIQQYLSIREDLDMSSETNR